MKALKNHLILYDADCPICKVYTRAMIDSGLLEKDGRGAYQALDTEVCPMVDRQRAANEIALVNLETGEVSYGIRSLFKIFATAAPVLAPLLTFGPFVWLMSKVYAFIAYNRRVIVPPAKSTDPFAIQPAFRLDYRIAYFLLTTAFTAYMVATYIRVLNAPLPIGYFTDILLILTGQFLLQGLLSILILKAASRDYLGNLMTVHVIVALLLVPVVAVSTYFDLPQKVHVVYLLVIGLLVLFEYFRRARILSAGYVLMLSWLLYYAWVILL